VSGLWRYPIKSLAGERLDELFFDERGVKYDRLWAIVDDAGGIASGKTTRRFRKVDGLLRHSSRLQDDTPVISLADGRSAVLGTVEADQLVHEIAGQRWSLQRENAIPHFDEGGVHLLTTATLATLSSAVREPITVERLRPNLLLEVGGGGLPEDEWVGRAVHIGEVTLRVTNRTIRCVMVNQAQARLPARRDALKAIGRVNQAYAGVYAQVLTPGWVRAGDTVEVE